MSKQWKPPKSNVVLPSTKIKSKIPEKEVAALDSYPNFPDPGTWIRVYYSNCGAGDGIFLKIQGDVGQVLDICTGVIQDITKDQVIAIGPKITVPKF